MTNFVMTNNVNMLGYKLKELRTNKKLKTMDVAQNLRIDQSLISKFESGLRIPTKEQLESLIELYEANSVELLNLWFASKVMSTIKEYPHYEDVLALVNEELSGYQKLINKSKQQVLSKPLMKILNEIDVIKKKIDALKPLSKTQLLKLNEYFFTDYTYESNKIEGNTLSLQETALVIKEGVTIGGKSVREHLEAINHKEAIDFVNDIAKKSIHITERTIKELHYLVLKGIITNDAGKYRHADVRITGSKHEPPVFFDVPQKMEELIAYYNRYQKNLHPVILAADMHQILVGIHPFIDGNGRTSRLLMNLILLQNGYYIANIKGNLTSKLKYYQSLERAHVHGQLSDFRLLVAKAVKHSLIEFYDLVKS